jgi:transcription antitermination factor NusG
MGRLLSRSNESAASNCCAESTSASWYALYTCSRHEKQVAKQLEQRQVNVFLPLYPSVRRWKDRRVELQLPLFPSYVFVHFPLQQRVEVLNVPGAVRFVAFNGRPAAVAENDLVRLRSALTAGLDPHPHPYLRIGRRVRVCSGPLAGMEGILVRKKDRFRLVLSIDIIMRSVAVEVDASDVEPLA